MFLPKRLRPNEPVVELLYVENRPSDFFHMKTENVIFF